MSQKRKVVIIGTGHVGSHCAYSLCHLGVCDELVLIDTDTQKVTSHVIDISDMLAFMPSPVKVRAGDYSDCADADIVAVSAGVPRLPGQTRLDTLGASINVIKEILPPLKNSGFDGILITITNPADIVADYMHKYLDLPKERVFSTGTALDTARLKRVLSEVTGVNTNSITAFSLGEHGDSQIVPFSCINVGGIPFLEFIKGTDISLDEIQTRTRMIGMDIINGKNATEFGIGSAFANMVKNILNDEKKIMPVSAYLDGEYGQHGLHAGVPVVLGRNGIERIIELDLNDEERAGFNNSCDIIKKLLIEAPPAGVGIR